VTLNNWNVTSRAVAGVNIVNNMIVQGLSAGAMICNQPNNGFSLLAWTFKS